MDASQEVAVFPEDEKRIVPHYAICHAMVDFACISTLLSACAPYLGELGGPAGSVMAVLVYDMAAFCLQLPFGALMDAVGKSGKAPLVSFGLVAAGAVLSSGSSAPVLWAAVVLVALGNALFHCAGGVDVLGISEGRATPSGLFICTGAAGVFLGRNAGGILGPALASINVGLMAVCCVLVLWLGTTPAARERADAAAPPSLGAGAWLAVALLDATVALRSYTGMAMVFPWQQGVAAAAAVVAAVVAGKAAGGFASDALGSKLAAILSLGAATALFPFSWEQPWAGVAAAFLFNFSMPITLVWLARLMPKNHGLAFGLASFSLAIGAAPALLGHVVQGGAALAVLSAASLALLVLGLATAERSRP